MNSKIYVMRFLVSTIFMLLFSLSANAQHRLHVFATPSYSIINTDHPSDASNVSNARWFFGVGLAQQGLLGQQPIEISFGYSHAQSTIFRYEGFNGDFSLVHRYRSIPIELFWIKPFGRDIDLKIGPNIVFQDRSLLYQNIDIDNDRIFGFGMGASGQMSMKLLTLNSGGYVSLKIGIRWTEFFVHDAKNRDIDDFKFRHVLLSPGIGVGIP